MEFPSAYLLETKRPFTNLLFVFPFLLTYELGIVWLGPATMRNGADLWLRQFLDCLGFGQYFLLPLVTVFVLLGWQHVSQQPWHCSPMTLAGMCAESCLFATALFAISELGAWLPAMLAAELPAATGGQVAAPPRLISFLGAGIYEELLFRLLLVPCLAGMLRGWGESPRTSWGTAVAVSSLLFAAAHYRIFAGFGEEFAWQTFAFRITAGLLFATLFLSRGFGITAAAHTLYDVLAGASHT